MSKLDVVAAIVHQVLGEAHAGSPDQTMAQRGFNVPEMGAALREIKQRLQDPTQTSDHQRYNLQETGQAFAASLLPENEPDVDVDVSNKTVLMAVALTQDNFLLNVDGDNNKMAKTAAKATAGKMTKKHRKKKKKSAKPKRTDGPKRKAAKVTTKRKKASGAWAPRPAVRARRRRRKKGCQRNKREAVYTLDGWSTTAARSWVGGVMLSLVLASNSAALAAKITGMPPLESADICNDATTSVVVKPKLASRLIEYYQLADVARRLSVVLAKKDPTRAHADEVWRTLFSTQNYCQEGRYGADLKCSADEADHLQRASLTMTLIFLNGKTHGFVPSHKAGMTFASWMASVAPGDDVVCKPDSAVRRRTTAKTVKGGFAWSNFRLRGYPEQLAYAHPAVFGKYDTYDTSDLFASTDGLSFNFKYNGGQKSRQDSVIGTLGYDFSWDSDPVVVDVVPFIAADDEITNNSSGTTVNTQTVAFGLLGAALVYNGWHQFYGQYVSIQPTYIMNLQDDSRLEAISLHYVPLVFNWINSFGTLGIEDLRGYLILDGRANFGTYSVVGTGQNAFLEKDYVRLGGRVGAAFEYDGIASNPINANVTYTSFAALSGYDKDLGELQATGTFNLTPDKLLGLTFSYRNGRREDTALRDESWTAGLTVKY